MSLREAWEAEAANWLAWARTPGHDSYWRFHRDRFLPILPPPAGHCLDVGCGEGRLTRDLRDRGYEMTGLDGSATLLAAAREADPEGTYLLGDAAHLPFADGTFHLVVAFMSYQDVDDLEAAGLAIEHLAEVGDPTSAPRDRWARMPLFLHMRAARR